MKKLKRIFNTSVPTPGGKGREWIREMISLKGDLKNVSLEDVIQWCVETNMYRRKMITDSIELTLLFHEERNNARKEFLKRLSEIKEKEINELNIQELKHLFEFIISIFRKDYDLTNRFVSKELENNPWSAEEYEELYLMLERKLYFKISRKRMDPKEKLEMIQNYFSNPKCGKLQMAIESEIAALKKKIQKRTKLQERKAQREERSKFPNCPFCKNNKAVIKKPRPNKSKIFGPGSFREVKYDYYCTIHKNKIEKV